MAVTVRPVNSTMEMYAHLVQHIADGIVTEFELQGSCLIPTSPKLKEAGYIQVLDDGENLLFGIRAYAGQPMLRRTYARIHSRLIEAMLVQLRDLCEAITVSPLPVDGIDEMEAAICADD